MLDQFNPANHPAIEIAAFVGGNDVITYQYDSNGLTVKSIVGPLAFLEAQL